MTVSTEIESTRVAASGAGTSAQAAPPAVSLEQVEKRFGDVVAVAGIDLEVRDGEFFSMLGPSGSGKTTTLRMIAGFEQPTSGRVMLHGRDVTGVPPFERDVNTVFQDALLEMQAANEPLYWTTYTDQMASYAAGDVVVGMSWQIQVNLLQAEDPPVPVAGVLPDEGSTGWSDTWMMAKDAANPNCMLMWMDHMMSAEANGMATVWFGEAATGPEACAFAETLSPGHCELTFADDEVYWDKIWYWSTPQADCADADEATTCKTQDDWVEAWTTLRGS